MTPEKMPECTELPDGSGTCWRDGAFSVICRWRNGEDGSRLGSISYENAPGVTAIRFPIVVKTEFPESGSLLLPDQYGIILHHPLTHIAVPSEYTCDPYDPEMIAYAKSLDLSGYTTESAQALKNTIKKPLMQSLHPVLGQIILEVDSKMKCLLILPRPVFPLVCGYSHKNYHLIQTLSEHYELHLVIISSDALSSDETDFYHKLGISVQTYHLSKFNR